MQDCGDRDQDRGPVVLVQVTPREYGRRSVVFIVGGILITAILSTRAKILMFTQSTTALLITLLVIARAVGSLQGG